jgi:hypothetical protein
MKQEQYQGPERRQSQAQYPGKERRRLDWPFKPRASTERDTANPGMSTQERKDEQQEQTRQQEEKHHDQH